MRAHPSLINRKASLTKYEEIWQFCRNMSLPSGIGIVILSFIVGQVFDSVRDWGIEGIYRCYSKRCSKSDIDWKYFSKASIEEIDKLDDNFYIWYVLNWNLAISMVAILLLVFLDNKKMASGHRSLYCSLHSWASVCFDNCLNSRCT